MCWIEIKDNINVQVADKDFEVYKIVLDANKQSCTSIVRGFNYTVGTLYAIPTIESKVIDPYCGKIKIEKHTIVILKYILYGTPLTVFIAEQLDVKICYLESGEYVFILKMIGI